MSDAHVQEPKSGWNRRTRISFLVSCFGLPALFATIFDILEGARWLPGPIEAVWHDVVVPTIMVLYLVSLVAALVFGLQIASRVRMKPGVLKGWRLAGVGVGLQPLLLLVFIALWNRYLPSGHGHYHERCFYNIKELTTAMYDYCRENNGRYPVDRWNDRIRSYTKREGVFSCPKVISGEPSYALNSRLLGIPQDQVKYPAETVMLFESIPGKNLAGGPELLPRLPRHRYTYNFSFADGHVSIVRQSEVGELNWDPGAMPSRSSE